MPISIQQLLEGDSQQFRDARLKALKHDPGVFNATHETESQRNETDWREILTHPDIAVFGIFDAAQSIGLTAISIDRNDPTKKRALLWASWLEPPYRGKGISRPMYQARIERALQHPTCEKINVVHRASNIASKYANQKHGFVYTGTHAERRWPDAAIEDAHDYELILKP